MMGLGMEKVSTDAIWAAFSDRLRAFIGKRVKDDNDVQDVLDIDAPGQAAEVIGSRTKFLGQQILGRGEHLGPAQGGQSRLEGIAMPGAGAMWPLDCA